MPLKYSANIGFLWDHLPLPERIAAAASAGFDAVECHFPYEHSSQQILSALESNKIPMIGINTLLGPPNEGLFGVAALVGKQELARGYIDQALQYASEVGAGNVNVVAGAGENASDEVFCENLTYACSKAADMGITIVIEPLNPRSVPDYLFSRVEHAVSIIESVSHDNLKLMFDFFHTQIVQGDLAHLLEENRQHIGHIQISAIHDRGEPDQGEVNYAYLLKLLENIGYTGYIGAEYKPRGQTVESGLSWLEQFRMF